MNEITRFIDLLVKSAREERRISGEDASASLKLARATLIQAIERKLETERKIITLKRRGFWGRLRRGPMSFIKIYRIGAGNSSRINRFRTAIVFTWLLIRGCNERS